MTHGGEKIGLCLPGADGLITGSDNSQFFSACLREEISRTMPVNFLPPSTSIIAAKAHHLAADPDDLFLIRRKVIEQVLIVLGMVGLGQL